MDAITSSLSGLFTNSSGGLDLGKLLLGGTGVLGTIGNIQANSARNQVLGSEQKLTQNYTNLANDPSKVAAGIAQLQAPLSQGLVSSVGNTVQGQAAERGLSTSPGIYSTMLSQALAPYQLQEQQLASDAYFKSLGLPISARPSPFGPFPQSTNTSNIWQMLLRQNNPGLYTNPSVGSLPFGGQSAPANFTSLPPGGDPTAGLSSLPFGSTPDLSGLIPQFSGGS